MGGHGQTVTELFTRVVKPLVLGGPVFPLDPIGPVAAPELAQQATRALSAADSSWVDVARVRCARTLCPVDALPSIGEHEWLMIVAINDLLRSTDPELKTFLSPGRAGQVVAGVLEILDQVPASRTIGEALVRHATFQQMMSARRTDTVISWWCGSRAFAGRQPPDRLLSWPRVRRVRTNREELDLAAMAAGSEATKATYLDAVRALLARTPLTDLATAGRAAPPFAWTSPTVSLLGVSSGRNIALRVLRMNASSQLFNAVRGAARTMDPPPSADVRRLVGAAIQELEAWAGAA